MAGWLLLAVAAAAAVWVAVERAQELQSAGHETVPAETTASVPVAPSASPRADTGPTDTGPTDTGPTDTGPTDTGPEPAEKPVHASGAQLAEEMTESDSEPALATASEASFSKRLRQASRAATVRVVNRSERVTGSGTVVASSADFACVLTAAHLVRFGDDIAIDAFDGDDPRIEQSVSDVQVWGLDPANDLALLWVPGAAQLAVSVKIRPPQSTPAAKEVAVLALTCTDSEPPSFYFETVTRRAVRKRATAEPVEIWEGERLGFRGQSGGALVDPEGYLIGVRSGIANGKAYYAHHSAIHQFLQTREFFTTSAASGGPPAHADLLRSLSEKSS